MVLTDVFGLFCSTAVNCNIQTIYFIMCLSKRAFELQGKTDSKFLTDAAFICYKAPLTAAVTKDMIK
jgi:hypothetical protein